MSTLKRILCFGDSNTWGPDEAGNRLPEKDRWTGILAGLLGSGTIVIEEGLNGRAIVNDDVIEGRLSALRTLPDCLESHRPLNLVIIMLGTNDLKKRFSLTARDIATGAGLLADMAMHRQFGAGGDAPKVLLVSPIHLSEKVRVGEFREIFAAESAATSRELAFWFEQTARLHGCAFLNAADHASFGKHDGIHLDRAGHLALADTLNETIVRLGI